MFSLGEIIDFAIRIEENGEAFYRQAEKKGATPEIKALFQSLAEDEVRHQEWFAAMKTSLKREDFDPALTGPQRGMFQEIIGNQTFSLNNADLSRLETEDEVLDLAIEFERDTIVFFEMILAFVDEETVRGKVREFIREENRHISLLEAQRNKNPALDIL